MAYRQPSLIRVKFNQIPLTQLPRDLDDITQILLEYHSISLIEFEVVIMINKELSWHYFNGFKGQILSLSQGKITPLPGTGEDSK